MLICSPTFGLIIARIYSSAHQLLDSNPISTLGLLKTRTLTLRKGLKNFTKNEVFIVRPALYNIKLFHRADPAGIQIPSNAQRHTIQVALIHCFVFHHWGEPVLLLPKLLRYPVQEIKNKTSLVILHLNKETKVMHNGEHNFKIAELTVSDPDWDFRLLNRPGSSWSNISLAHV